MIKDDTIPDSRTDEVTLRNRAQCVLRDAILDGHFRPGQKLVERELSTLTGASRSVIRESLAHLEATGLIRRESYRGFTVAELSEANIREIYELRASVETLAAELFADRASEEEMQALANAMSDLEICMIAYDVSRTRLAKERYYDVVFSGCRNSEIRRALENVIDRIYYLRVRTMQDPIRRRASLEEMRRLTDALLARDVTKARAASLAHIEGARDAMLGRLAAQRYSARAKAVA